LVNQLILFTHKKSPHSAGFKILFSLYTKRQEARYLSNVPPPDVFYV